MNLSDKTVLLTGASGGIGTETAKLLAAAGARLILVGRNKQKLDTVAHELPDGQTHRTIVADLSRDEGLQAIVAQADSIDVLINLAGVNQLAMLEQMDDVQLSSMIDSNLIVPMKLCKNLLPALKSRPQAAIVNVGSIFGSIGMAGSSAYCASKFGLRGFTEAMQRELDDTNISVIYIAPRATNTAMNNASANALNEELGNHVDSPDLVARSIVNALQKNSSLNHYLGWPEKLFVRINSVLPKLVSGSLKKQLPIIQRHTQT